MKKLILGILIIVVFSSCAFAWKVNVGEREINLFNYLQVRYAMGPATTDQFSIPRLRTDIWGDISEHVGYFMEYDFVSDPAIVYGWIDYKTPIAKVTAGRMYLPFGLEYTTPPSRFDTISPTNTLWNYFAYSRDIGIQLSNKYDQMKYYIALVNGADNTNIDDNSNKDIVGRVVFTPIDGVAIGFSGYNGVTSTLEVSKKIAGLEANINYGSMELKSEYMEGSISGIRSRGWYLQPLLNLSKSVQALLRYENWDPNTNSLGDMIATITLGVNIFCEDNTKIQINYEIKTETGAQLNNDALLIQSQVNF